jgi:8-hydroxy-5-deazaflavin:NADPH oxidoreductase
MTSIGVIGGGNIGRTVGAAWQRAGHDVRYSSRSPAPPETVSVADAIAHAEAVLLSVPGGAVPALLAEHGRALAGRLVIDATNDAGGGPLSHPEAYGHAPDARFVRAFNSLGWELFAEPAIGGAVADLFWCGPQDAEALLADVGLRPVRVGDIDAIDVVDGVGRLWLTLVFRQGHPRRLAFRMLTEE